MLWEYSRETQATLADKERAITVVADTALTTQAEVEAAVYLPHTAQPQAHSFSFAYRETPMTVGFCAMFIKPLWEEACPPAWDCLAT